MEDIFKEYGHKRKMTVKFISSEIVERYYRHIPDSTLRYLMKTFINKSWQKVTTTTSKYESDVANERRAGYLKLMSFVIIELYLTYDEIYFIDEFYVWNNEKNGEYIHGLTKEKTMPLLNITGNSKLI